MSVRVDTSSLISGAVVCGNRGLGVTGAVIRATTATGTHGAGWLYDNWDDSSDDDKEFRLEIESGPSSGSLFVDEDGSLIYTPDGDGTFPVVGRFWLDGADEGTETNYLVSGSGAATGQLAATEAADTAAATGTVLVSGALAATEASDTASMSGTVSSGTVTGTLAATEAPDVASFIGAEVVSGSLAATEAIDTAAISGAVRVTGALAASESADVAAFDGASSLGVRASNSSRTRPELSGSARPSQASASRRPRQLS